MADEWDLSGLTDRWQRAWWEVKAHHAERDPASTRPAFFIHFAYPGISGFLHVGHMRGFTYTDVFARYKRMSGHDVLFPAGFHASGIPAVAFAAEVRRGEKTDYLRSNGYDGPLDALTDPKAVVDYFARVYTNDYWKKFGFLIDERRNCTTIDPGYNRFIQWQFRRLKDLGFIIDKPHYAPFCPVAGPVAVDKSETDIKQGGSAEVLEFLALRFTMHGDAAKAVLSAATTSSWTMPGEGTPAAPAAPMPTSPSKPGGKSKPAAMRPAAPSRPAKAHAPPRALSTDDLLVVPCATLRPETVFGVTNVWVRPDHEYELVRVWRDGAVKDTDPSEVWIVSKQGRVKLEWQCERAQGLGLAVPGNVLSGLQVTVPVTDKIVPIVAGAFVDPLIATGLVMSVPGHAPFDYAAYVDAGLDKTLGEPPQIVKVQGYNDLPARVACRKHKITSQADKAALEAATTEVYEDEFNKGVLTEACGPYAGQRIKGIKDRIRADFTGTALPAQATGGSAVDGAAGSAAGPTAASTRATGAASSATSSTTVLVASPRAAAPSAAWDNPPARIIRQFSEPVISRAGQVVDIKRIPDQSFIHYADDAWTKKAQAHGSTMRIFPQTYKDEFGNVLQWFGDRACVRRGAWLGTEFPFKPGWIIEPISDSTFYPWYYIVSRYLRSEWNPDPAAGGLLVADLCDEFFDYVFNGRGDPESAVARSLASAGRSADRNTVEAKAALWRMVRDDVLHWGPVDINLGGKEHQTVHFPVYVLNQVALLDDPRLWPKGLFVNWWVTQKAGAKISKSKGGAEPIPNAAKQYGVDPMRLYYCHVGSPHVDIEWDPDVVVTYRQRVQRNCRLVDELLATAGGPSPMDAWLESAVARSLRNAREAYEQYDLRNAAGELAFTLPEQLRWYLRRGGANKDLLNRVVRDWSLAVCPITPHVAEEMWARAHAAVGDANVGGTVASGALAGGAVAGGPMDRGASGTNGAAPAGAMSAPAASDVAVPRLATLQPFPQWPEADESVLAGEEQVRLVIDDIQTIRKLAGVDKPTRLVLYTTPKWKGTLARTALEMAEAAAGKFPVAEFMKKAMADPENRARGKAVQNFAGKLPQQIVAWTPAQKSLVRAGTDEKELLAGAVAFIAAEVGAPKVDVFAADDPAAPDHPKKELAGPLKPGIALE